MKTLVPIDRFGRCEVRDEEGRKIASATARPSSSRPGYITIVMPSLGRDHCIRVPADWLDALARSDADRRKCCDTLVLDQHDANCGTQKGA